VLDSPEDQCWIAVTLGIVDRFLLEVGKFEGLATVKGRERFIAAAESEKEEECAPVCLEAGVGVRTSLVVSALLLNPAVLAFHQATSASAAKMVIDVRISRMSERRVERFDTPRWVQAL